MKSKLILASLLLGTSTLAHAEWIKIGSNDDLTVYVDNSGRMINAAGNRVYRTLHEFRNANSFEGVGRVKSIVLPLEVDCTGARVKYGREFMSYSEPMGKGKATPHVKDDTWQKVGEKHVLNVLVGAVCALPPAS